MKIDINFSISESAANELKKAAGEGFIRISAQPSGCSGTSYGLGIVEKEDISSSDILEEFRDIKVVVDKATAMHLDGVVLDWHVSEGIEGFKFISPKPASCCRKGGCSS